METKDLLKWALIAVAGYLVYKYLSGSGMFGGAPQVEAGAGAGAGAGGGAVPTSTGGTSVREGATEGARDTGVTRPAGYVTFLVEDLQKFARDRMGAAWNGLLTISEWNWMVSNLTKVNQQVDLSFGQPVPDPISLTDYMARRTRAGVSGLGLIGDSKGVGDIPAYFPNFYNAWTI